MIRIALVLAALALATPAAAQYQMRTARPDHGTPTSRAGSYTNPYVVQDQQGRQMGTVYSARPNGSGNSRPGSYANPYEYHPNNNYQRNRYR